jgi:hypothetical protein
MAKASRAMKGCVRVGEIFEFVESIEAMLRSFSHLALPARRVSIRVLLFD